MGSHEYRGAYFRNPELMQPELLGFFDQLVTGVREQVEEKTTERNYRRPPGSARAFMG